MQRSEMMRGVDLAMATDPITRQRRSGVPVCLLLLAAMCAALILAPQTYGAVAHLPEGSFTGSDAPGGPFEVVFADAADESGGPSNGDVYVGEVEAVDKFHADGSYAGVRITGAATPQGSFDLISGEDLASGRIAVDSSADSHAGSMYVADVEHGVVDRFSESGVYECQITGLAVPSASECNGGAGSLTPDGSIEPTGIAVEKSTGDVYVGDLKHAAIDRFSSKGAYIEQVRDSHIVTPGPIALDSAGNLYVVNAAPFFGVTTENDLVRFHNGSFAAVIDSEELLSVAIDSTNAHVYAYEEKSGQVAEFSSGGSGLEDRFRGRELGISLSITVGPSGRVYPVTTLGGSSEPANVTMFSNDKVVPTTTTGSAEGLAETSATVTGTVDPDVAHGGGEVTGCHFEYVTAESFEAHAEEPFEGALSSPCVPAPPFSVATSVTASLAALSPSTRYRYRLVSSNADGTEDGAPAALATVGPPVISGLNAIALAPTDATVEAVVIPSGFDTECRVEYVTESDFTVTGYTHALSASCAPETISSSQIEQHVAASLDGLVIGTTYRFRFVASNKAGETSEPEGTFATFGVKAFTVETLDATGQPSTQAGEHPYELRTSFDLATTSIPPFVLPHANFEAPVANLKDVVTELPPGLIANPTATARCPRYEVAIAQCSADSQVGMIEVEDGERDNIKTPLFNVVPRKGVPFELGAVVQNLVRIYIDGNVRTGGDYGATAIVENASEQAGVTSTSVSLWGVPADPRHDVQRVCPIPGLFGKPPCDTSAPRTPFLTNPTSCTGTQLVATLKVDSWQDPGDYVTAKSGLPATTGCQVVSFSPTVAMRPTVSTADSPSGFDFTLKVPQNGQQSSLASSALRNTVVALPTGMSLSPAAGNGLQACSEDQIGLNDDAHPSCPDASKIGTVEIITPLLHVPLDGDVYVARQGENPFHSLLAIYVVAEAEGALIKLAGHVVADPTSGQLTTTFSDSPQLPFSELRLHLFGGPRGALATPEACGTYGLSALLTPWSSSTSVDLSEPFVVSGGCVSGFAPTFTGGAVVPAAGVFSPLTLAFARSDTDQDLSKITATLPSGVLAKLAGVPRCTDAQAAAASCPVSSQIGTLSVTAGPGERPLSLPGSMYLTGAYGGAPYGEVVVVPVVAGPFNLGNVVVRGSISIDPNSARATVSSDPFPAIVEGIPTHLRGASILVNRRNFSVTPTSCAPESFAGYLQSGAGAESPLTTRFAVGGCRALGLAPKFSASTHGPGSRANGAMLAVKLLAPGQGPHVPGAKGAETNIRKVEVQLPKALPSEQRTLRLACTERQFLASPTTCPKASKVGRSTVHTPLLETALQGTAYLVSHGGAAFPDLVIVLEGSGIRIDLTGHTQIRHGITYSRFETVPDAPVSSFELQLPAGPQSLLGAFGNLCSKKVQATLKMPTTITGQNGAVFRQSTKISVSGCHLAKPSSKAREATGVRRVVVAGKLRKGTLR